MMEMSRALLFAQNEYGPGGAGGGGGVGGAVFWVAYIALIVVAVAGIWMTFVKAGKPGWGAIVPIYNIILILEIAGRPIWWIILLLIPFVNIVVSIIVSIDFARKFGKGVGFGLGLAFLGFIFYPILGFGSAQYQPNA